MEVRTQANSHDPKRVAVLILQAGTFEEERILTAISQAIITAGEITTTSAVDDETDRVLTFNFRPISKKNRHHG
jgi:hypothetical protein